ncbi:MAG: hypothetical protein V3S37_05950 [Dehalococcoidia bacterium]
MHRIATYLTIIGAMLLISCGGGGAEDEEAGGAGGVIPIPISISGDGLDPNEFEIEVGKQYKFVLTNNNASLGSTLMCQRWCGQTFAGAGKTNESTAFIVTEASEFACWDRNFGKDIAFKCTVVVK